MFAIFVAFMGMLVIWYLPWVSVVGKYFLDKEPIKSMVGYLFVRHDWASPGIVRSRYLMETFKFTSSIIVDQNRSLPNPERAQFRFFWFALHYPHFDRTPSTIALFDHVICSHQSSLMANLRLMTRI
jgi:hypothetical protein